MNLPTVGRSIFQPTGLTPDRAWRALNLRQRRFVVYYHSTPNAALAARQAGYSANGAKVQGHRLLARPEIQAAFQYDGLEMARALARTHLPEEIKMLAQMASDESLRVIDSVRAHRLLMEIGGYLKSRRGRRG